MSLPKVLIFGQPFNNTHGGGITLSNLFKGWEKDKIAIAATGHLMYNVTTDVCDIYYQLGNKEFKWRFPFNLIQRNFSSGLKTFDNKSEVPRMPDKLGLRYILVNRYFYPALEWLGLFHCSTKIEMSQDFKIWFSEFRPDIVYLQVSTREAVLFAADFTDYLKIPSVIHVMDDWPSTISKSGPLKKYWNRRIDREFKLLLDKVDLHLSISDAMSEEYFKRYQIDIKKYDINGRNELKQVDCFRILCVGRVGTANKESIIMFARVISQFKSGPPWVTMDIFTKEIDTFDLEFIDNSNNIKIKPPVPHYEIPALLQDYDLLLLPLDFTEIGLKFAQFSIPTKVSEYMLSGTPILVFDPKETAVSMFFSQNKCGYCVTRQDTIELEQAVRFLINDREYCKKISHRAMILAKEKFDAEKVRHKFQRMLIDLSVNGIS